MRRTQDRTRGQKVTRGDAVGDAGDAVLVAGDAVFLNRVTSESRARRGFRAKRGGW
jgi:hypothetical protein